MDTVPIPSPKIGASTRSVRLDLLVAVLDSLEHTAEPITLDATSSGEAEDALRVIFDLLPHQLTADLTFSTFEPTNADDLVIRTLIAPFAEPPKGPCRVVNLADRDVPASSPNVDLAERLLARRSRGEPILASASVRELRGLLKSEDLLRVPPSQMKPTDLLDVLAGPRGDEYSKRHPETASVALTVARDPRYRPLASAARGLLTDAMRLEFVKKLEAEAVNVVFTGHTPDAEIEIASLLGPPRVEIGPAVTSRLRRDLLAGKISASALRHIGSLLPSETKQLPLPTKSLWLEIDSSPLRGDDADWSLAGLVSALRTPRAATTWLQRWLEDDKHRARVAYALGLVVDGIPEINEDIPPRVRADYAIDSLAAAARSSWLPTLEIIWEAGIPRANTVDLTRAMELLTPADVPAGALAAYGERWRDLNHVGASLPDRVADLMRLEPVKRGRRRRSRLSRNQRAG